MLKPFTANELLTIIAALTWLLPRIDDKRDKKDLVRLIGKVRGILKEEKNGEEG